MRYNAQRRFKSVRLQGGSNQRTQPSRLGLAKRPQWQPGIGYTKIQGTASLQK